MTRIPNDIAQAIVDLINSKPRTPTKDELAAIIAKAVPAPSAARSTYLASDWCRALENHLEARSRISTDDDDAHNALDARLTDVTEAICAKPVWTPGDVIERAAVAVHGGGSTPATPVARRSARLQPLCAACLIWPA